MTQLDKLILAARAQWPEMPRNVKIRHAARGTRVILKDGCCKRIYVELQPFEEAGQIIGYAKYHEDTKTLFVKVM